MSDIRWKQFTGFTIEGKPYQVNPKALDADKTLLQRITNMPTGKQISLASAYNTHALEIVSCLLDDCSADKAAEVMNIDFVLWISRQGFQIILSGDEYEI